MKCGGCSRWFLTGDCKEWNASTQQMFHAKCMQQGQPAQRPDDLLSHRDRNHVAAAHPTQVSLVERVEFVEHAELEEQLIRWACAVCTFAENHPIADCCAVCQAERGAPPLVWEQEPLQPGPQVPPQNEDASPASHLAGYQQNLAWNPHTFPENVVCGICAQEFSRADCTIIAENCTPCNECLAGWVNAQVGSGQSLRLKCPCGAHSLQYRDVAAVVDLLPNTAVETYGRLQTTNALPADSKESECPSCRTVNTYYAGHESYNCRNPRCFDSDIPICTKHNELYSRPTVTRVESGETYEEKDMRAPRACQSCLRESSGDMSMMALIRAIEMAFCDRCPGCGNFVGEPESFDSCMCLVCNHCGNGFCAFCYEYSGGWRDTHEHVRYCPHNPRENYFVESEQEWRRLMRERRMRIAEAIISTATLSHTDQAAIRSRVQNLL